MYFTSLSGHMVTTVTVTVFLNRYLLIVFQYPNDHAPIPERMFAYTQNETYFRTMTEDKDPGALIRRQSGWIPKSG